MSSPLATPPAARQAARRAAARHAARRAARRTNVAVQNQFFIFLFWYFILVTFG
jgi:hypothetical protein